MTSSDARTARLELECDAALKALAVAEAEREKLRAEQRTAIEIDIKAGRLP